MTSVGTVYTQGPTTIANPIMVKMMRPTIAVMFRRNRFHTNDSEGPDEVGNEGPGVIGRSLQIGYTYPTVSWLGYYNLTITRGGGTYNALYAYQPEEEGEHEDHGTD